MLGSARIGADANGMAMKRSSAAWFYIATSTSVAVSFARAAPPAPEVDPLCVAIRTFANATPDNRAHSITVYSQLYDVEAVANARGSPMSSRHCEDDSTREGTELCRAVLSNVSYEFPASAGTRSVACLSGQPYDMPQGVSAVLKFAIAVRTFGMKGVRPGTQVDAEYQTLQGSTSNVGVFRLFASRKHPD